MENFNFVIRFTIDLLENNDMDGAQKMVDGCTSKFNIVDLQLTPLTIKLFKEIDFTAAAQDIINALLYIRMVYNSQKQGVNFI